MGYSPIKISSNNTCWIFISGSHEKRHLYDLLHWNTVLLSKGVSPSDIYFFIDYPQKKIDLPLFGVTQNVFDTQDINSQFPQIKGYEFSYVLVGGHGSVTGVTMGNGTTISPCELIDQIRNIPDIESGCLVLTQCYAGVFNLLNAGEDPKHLVIIGATNLYKSLSIKTDIGRIALVQTNGQKITSWYANIFSLYLANWFANTVDVDGDGSQTLMDAYKFCGVSANEHLTSAKRGIHAEIGHLQAQQLALLGSISVGGNTQQSLTSLLQARALITQINQSIDNLYLNQEPWILHSNFARKISIW